MSTDSPSVPTVAAPTDRFDADSGWYGGPHCPLRPSTPVVTTDRKARDHLPGCRQLRDVPLDALQGSDLAEVPPAHRNPCRECWPSLGSTRAVRTLQARSSTTLAEWFLDEREVVRRQGLERRPDADPAVDDELRATARAALVVSDDWVATDERVDAVAELLAQLRARGRCHRRDLQPRLDGAVPVGDRRPLVTAVADAVDHVVRVGREARYRWACDPIR